MDAGRARAGPVGPAKRARACSPEPSPAATAIPRAGTSAVSTATSIVVVSSREPFGVSVLGRPGGHVSSWRAIGSGIDGSGGPTSFWQLSVGLLAASADYVVTLPAAGADGDAATLTTFSTAAGYDKAAGTPANLRSVHLWRVRYPVADIASGNCVFAEYASFVTVDYDLATIPNTTPGSVIQIVPARARHRRDHARPSSTPAIRRSRAWRRRAPTRCRSGAWQPDLDPTRRYCLAISAIGDGDLARLGTGSNQVCADVVQLSATGAPPPPAISGGTRRRLTRRRRIWRRGRCWRRRCRIDRRRRRRPDRRQIERLLRRLRDGRDARRLAGPRPGRRRAGPRRADAAGVGARGRAVSRRALRRARRAGTMTRCRRSGPDAGAAACACFSVSSSRCSSRWWS